jgi:hypothetical protein
VIDAISQAAAKPVIIGNNNATLAALNMLMNIKAKNTNMAHGASILIALLGKWGLRVVFYHPHLIGVAPCTHGGQIGWMPEQVRHNNTLGQRTPEVAHVHRES